MDLFGSYWKFLEGRKVSLEIKYRMSRENWLDKMDINALRPISICFSSLWYWKSRARSSFRNGIAYEIFGSLRFGRKALVRNVFFMKTCREVKLNSGFIAFRWISGRSSRHFLRESRGPSSYNRTLSSSSVDWTGKINIFLDLWNMSGSRHGLTLHSQG